MRILLIVAIAIAGMALPAVAPDARADPLKCQRTIQSAHRKYLKSRTRIVQKCQDSSVRKATPPSPTSCPITADDDRLLALELKLRARIAAKCGGSDGICNGVGDEPLASIGWDIGACPDLNGEGCTNAIATCDDVATCLACIADEAVTNGNGIAYDQLDGTEFATGSESNSCQRALGKETVKYFQARGKFLGKCWDKVLKGVDGYTDPPGCPLTDTKIIEKLDRAERKKVDKICKACGAGGDADQDGQCDDPGAAFTALEIGFEPDCPDLVVPSSKQVCLHADVSTLADVIDCVGCVTDFVADCGGAASVPGATTYPSECN